MSIILQFSAVALKGFGGEAAGDGLHVLVAALAAGFADNSKKLNAALERSATAPGAPPRWPWPAPRGGTAARSPCPPPTSAPSATRSRRSSPPTRSTDVDGHGPDFRGPCLGCSSRPPARPACSTAARSTPTNWRSRSATCRASAINRRSWTPSTRSSAHAAAILRAARLRRPRRVRRAATSGRPAAARVGRALLLPARGRDGRGAVPGTGLRAAGEPRREPAGRVRRPGRGARPARRAARNAAGRRAGRRHPDARGRAGRQGRDGAPGRSRCRSWAQAVLQALSPAPDWSSRELHGQRQPVRPRRGRTPARQGSGRPLPRPARRPAHRRCRRCSTPSASWRWWPAISSRPSATSARWPTIVGRPEGQGRGGAQRLPRRPGAAGVGRGADGAREAVTLDRGRFAPFPVGKYRAGADPRRGRLRRGVPVPQPPLRQAQVVVKTLRRDGLDRDLDEVFREAQALEALDHPAIIRVRDCDYADAERDPAVPGHGLLRGPDLAELRRAERPLPSRELLPLAPAGRRGLAGRRTARASCTAT